MSNLSSHDPLRADEQEQTIKTLREQLAQAEELRQAFVATINTAGDFLKRVLDEDGRERDELQSQNAALQARFDKRFEDSMIAHRWFATQFGEIMNGRDFSAKCPMADEQIAALRERIAELEMKLEQTNRWSVAVERDRALSELAEARKALDVLLKTASWMRREWAGFGTLAGETIEQMDRAIDAARAAIPENGATEAK